MTFNIIVAVDKKYGIGKNGGMCWHHPQDLKFFRATTIDSTIIMGRVTFESIGRALSRRRNVVITSSNIDKEGIETFPTLKDALDKYEGETIFVIGGEQLYNEAVILENCDRVYVSHIADSSKAFGCDKFFPYKYVTKNYKLEHIIKDDDLFVEIFKK